MKREKCTMSNFFHLPKLAQCIDDRMRISDLRLNRTKGGLLDRKMGIPRHSCQYILLPALLAGIMVMGTPKFGLRYFLAVAISISVFGLFVLVGRFAARRHLSLRNEMALQAGMVLAIGGVLWMLGGDVYHEDILIYRNFFILAAGVVGAALLLCWLLSGWVWTRWKIQNNYNQAITKTELFSSRDKQIPLGLGRFLRAFFTVIQGAPLQLFLLSAVVALFARPDWLTELTMGTFIFSYLVLAMGGLDARLNQMWGLFRNAFFRGGTRLVSLLIIVLAAARIFGVSYVTTVFDTAEGVVIAILLLSAYVLLWWYDYWINRLIAQELIKLLDKTAVSDAQIPYPIGADAVATAVPQSERVIQIHGASRFIVIRHRRNQSIPYFQAYSFAKLFQSLSAGGFPGGKAVPSARQIDERIFDFKSLAATILVALAVLVTWSIFSGEQAPQLALREKLHSNIKIAELLKNHRRANGDQPALIVAASGGGTRAALYTTAVLEGLSKRNKLQNVIMGSGVSGGGAALAYFAGKRAELVRPEKKAWDSFFKIMEAPYIQDVINGALEWRIVSKSRLGVLLSDSFERHWALAETNDQIGEIKGFGLILNTSIAGRFACNGTAKDCFELPIMEAERRFRDDMTHSDLAGGRLILTNLLLDSAFVPPVVEVGGPEGLPVVVDHPETPLYDAAALNANFSPVFSNAAVDLFNKERYWVTDGGAVDNRGIEMPLYALREALKKNSIQSAAPLPAIKMIAIDASSYSKIYSQDRGVGSLVSAGTQLASLQVMELLDSIRAMYAKREQKKDFQFIYLPMPLCLRESGSFGTHWMLQPTIEVNLENDDRRSLAGTEMVKLLRAMYSPEQEGSLSPDAREILAFSKKDMRWREGALKLGFVEDNKTVFSKRKAN